MGTRNTNRDYLGTTSSDDFIQFSALFLTFSVGPEPHEDKN